MARSIRTMAAAFALTMAALAITPMVAQARAERVLETLPSTDLPGGDYRTLREVPLAACRSACLGDAECAAFTYNQQVRWCFLKAVVGERTPYDGATSAVVREAEDGPALALPDISYLPASLGREAERLAARVDAVRSGGRDAGPVRHAMVAALDSASSAAWRDYAATLLTERREGGETVRPDASTAAAAGLVALQKAASPEAQARALAIISRAMERQGLTRPAIEAAAAGVALAGTAKERNRLAELRARYGFRVLDYSVDVETQTPRLCVQVSEPLQGDATDLERFVALDGRASTTLSMDDRQLCVEGLEHGKRYTVSLREGLPATTGEVFTAPAEFVAFVRDRSPVARFATNRYVLPSTSRGIPLTTINTERLALALYRINDRNLAEVVRRGEFKRQLYPYEAEEIAQERGALAWSGSMDVALVRNEEATTLFPASDVIETVEPGVYVLTAQPDEATDRSGPMATQWFVISALGLSTFSADGTVDVFARSLTTGEPIEGAALELLAKNDEVLATARTDGEGHARLTSLAPTDAGRAPALVTARKGEGDYAFVNLLSAPFELTDRGVDGRTPPGPVDAFLATERGVYRAGETVHLTALVRDDRAAGLDVPVTVKLVRPDGKVSRTLTRRAEFDGGFALDLQLTGNAATGSWTITAHLDPEGAPVGITNFLLEDFVPQRIEVALTSSAESARAGEAIEATLAADFLYGAPAADLILEGSATLRGAAGVEGWEGYRFGLETEPFRAQREPLAALPRTGADGRAALTVAIPEPAAASGPLEAEVAVNVREPGGRQVGDSITLPILDGRDLIGIRPRFEGDRVGEGSIALFEAIALDGARTRTRLDVRWTLTRIEQDFQWYRQGDRWAYQPVERLEEVASGTEEIAADAPLRLETPVGWGRYRLEVADAATGGVASSLTFSAGWVNLSASADTPDVLDVQLDRESYAAGDVATLRISPRRAGRTLVTVLAGSLEEHRMVEVPAEGASVDIDVAADWVPGAYVVATHFADPQALAGDARPLPQRSVGVAHLDVDTAPRRLAVAIGAPDLLSPRQRITVPVEVDGLAPGERAHLTVAAVNVGILNLTGYEAPDVDGHYLGRRRLGVELRDLYGDLIDGAGATRGVVRSGGDGGGGASIEALPPTETPVSLFTGVIRTDASGVASASFDLPAFDGTLKMMAIAWTSDAVGDAQTEVLVRDPVVIAGSLPRFLAPGDATRLRVDLHNVAHEAGNYALSVEAMGPLDIDAPERTLILDRDERTSLEIPLAATGIGEGAIALTLRGPDGLELAKDFALIVRPAAAPVRERRLIALAPGEDVVLGRDLIEGFDDAAVTLSIGGVDIDTAGLLQLLERFPYGCAEQTVSRALPLLYANDVARSAGRGDDVALPERIAGSIDRLLAYQSTAGGFGLWAPGNDLWLTAYAMDFLSRAREEGYEVPEEAFTAGLDRLQSVLSFSGEISADSGGEIAYASYVLARNGRAAIGDLRYFAEEKLADFVTPLAKAQLAASLAFVGDLPLAERLFRQAALSAPDDERPDRIDYGTRLRDAAAAVTLAAESRVGQATVADLGAALARVRVAEDERPYSTQEAAWLVLSANATEATGAAIEVAGVVQSAPVHRILGGDDLRSGVPIRNAGSDALSVAATVTGTPLRPRPASAFGLRIERTYRTLDGGVTDGERVAQNERLLVTLTVAKTVDAPMRLMLTDLLPAGFEVENPRLVTDLPSALLAAVSEGPQPDHVEFRDDRFAAGWSLLAGSVDQPISVSYLVRAVTPGTFARPAAEVADMYQPRYLARTAAGTVAVLPTR